MNGIKIGIADFTYETTNAEGETVTTLPDETTSAEETSAPSANPAEWSEEEIIEFYKQAAKKSSSAKSQKTFHITTQ